MKKKVAMRAFTSIKVMMLVALMAFAPQGALAQNVADSYPVETVRWDNVPAENREMMEQLFADMVLVPESEGVKKFYISAREVQESLWAALMPKEQAAADSIVIDSLLMGEVPTAAEVSDTLKVDAVNSTAIQQFITLLHKQTGKRFRLPTDAERLLAAQSELIDTIADADDKSGKGFHLALDTLAKSEPKMLVITATDGTTTKYLLEGMPQVRIDKPYLVISSGMASVSLPLENLQHMHYEKATDEATAIGEIKAFDEKGGSERIDFSNLPAGAAVSIYTTDGKLLYNHRPAQGKTLSLPLDALQSGIYLVKVNDVTYKIQKP